MVRVAPPSSGPVRACLGLDRRGRIGKPAREASTKQNLKAPRDHLMNSDQIHALSNPLTRIRISIDRQASTNALAIACSSVIAHPSAQADAKASSPSAHGGDVALVCLAMDWRKEDTHGFADRCRCAEQVCRADRL